MFRVVLSDYSVGDADVMLAGGCDYAGGLLRLCALPTLASVHECRFREFRFSILKVGSIPIGNSVCSSRCDFGFGKNVFPSGLSVFMSHG